jgi:hypothetical protein
MMNDRRDRRRSVVLGTPPTPGRPPPRLRALVGWSHFRGGGGVRHGSAGTLEALSWLFDGLTRARAVSSRLPRCRSTPVPTAVSGAARALGGATARHRHGVAGGRSDESSVRRVSSAALLPPLDGRPRTSGGCFVWRPLATRQRPRASAPPNAPSGTMRTKRRKEWPSWLGQLAFPGQTATAILESLL